MSIASGVLRGLVRGYQLVISPLFPPSCKYSPTCSRYALDALTAHGALKGAALAAWRVLRCNPFAAGGYDPVPGTDPEHDAGKHHHHRRDAGPCVDAAHHHSASCHHSAP